MESPLVGTRTPVTLGNRNDKRSPDDSVRSSSVGLIEYDEETLNGDTDNDGKAGIDSQAVDSNKKNAVLGAEPPGNMSIRNINWTCPSFEHRETGQNASATCNQVPADVPQGNALQHAPSAIAMTDMNEKVAFGTKTPCNLSDPSNQHMKENKVSSVTPNPIGRVSADSQRGKSLQHGPSGGAMVDRNAMVVTATKTPYNPSGTIQKMTGKSRGKTVVRTTETVNSGTTRDSSSTAKNVHLTTPKQNRDGDTSESVSLLILEMHLSYYGYS